MTALLVIRHHGQWSAVGLPSNGRVMLSEIAELARGGDDRIAIEPRGDGWWLITEDGEHAVHDGDIVASGLSYARLRLTGDPERAIADERYLATVIDPLTGVANRVVLRALAQHPEPGCVLLADLDHFKRLNERHGHLVGDRVLPQVARAICNVVRGRGPVIRYGGEEFLIVLPGVPIAAARTLAEAVRAAVAAPPHVIDDGHEVPITISIGVAALAGDLTSAIANANERVDEAKGAGRNRVR